MILKIVAVWDHAVSAYGVPIFVNALGQAIRSFSDECNRKESAIGAHPKDYDLFQLGEYDDQTGNCVSLPVPVRIAVGQDLVVKE